MKNRNEWIVVGISGVTCGGKTTLANKLVASVRGARVFHQDRYFLADDDPRQRAVPGLPAHHNNYDVLSALDMPAMYRDVVRTIEGCDCSHTRHGAGAGGGGGGAARGGAWHFPGTPARRLLVIEGFTVLNYRPLYDVCDLRYYMTLEYGECFARRALRVYDPPDVPLYFELCVWPEHLRYKAEIEKLPHITMLDGRNPDVFEEVLNDLIRLGATEIKEP